MAIRRERGEYLGCAAMIAVALAWWFSPYLLHGYTFLSEAGQMLWADWVLSRHIGFTADGVSQWNPAVLFGVDWVGREAFLNPLNLGSLIGRLFPGDKLSFMASTLVCLAFMGASMYALLRTLEVRPAFARCGAAVYLLASKWADDGYHGPRFLAGYAILPLTLLLIVRMHETRFRRPIHFVVFAVLISLTYLGLGASFLLIQAYLVAPFFAYLLYRSWRQEESRGAAMLLRTGIALTCALALVVALSAYILLPFIGNWRIAERSLYGEAPGFGVTDYLGLVFPWINRLFARGVYDLPYPAVPPLLYPNVYFYVGILALPLLAIGFARRLWTPITAFFAWAFVAWLLLWNRYVIAAFPLIPTIDRLTQGNASQYQGHIILIASMSIVTGWTLQQVADRGEASWSGRGGRWLGSLNVALIGGYVAAAAAVIAGAVVLASPLRTRVIPHLNTGQFLVAHYYLREMAAVFAAMFLLRAAAVWMFHRRRYVGPLAGTALLAIMIADFELVYRTWYPFTDMDARYAADRLPNSFLFERADPLDRFGASQYSFVVATRSKALKAFALAPAPADYDEVVRRFGRIFDAGFRMPLYEPSFSYAPIAADRSFYGYHESLMPSYFWAFDTAMNAANPSYTRQSFIGVWDPHSPLLDVAGVKYLFWHEPIRDPRLVEVARYGNDSRIYLNQRAVPRAYLVGAVDFVPSDTAAMTRLAEPSFAPRERAVAEDRALVSRFAGRPAAAGGGEAHIDRYTPDAIDITASAAAPALLVLADMFHPNWRATVDDGPAPIYRVDGLFRGVVVPAGRSRVAFRYDDPLFHAGVAVSGVSWAGTVVLLAAAEWRRRRTRRGTATGAPLLS